MFKVTVAVVPPGGGETDYSFEIMLPALPNVEDYFQVVAKDVCMTHDFIVRRRWFHAEQPTDIEAKPVTYTGVVLEVEPALSDYSSNGHKAVCEMYKRRGKPLQELQTSVY